MVRGVDTAAAVLPIRKKDENQPDAGRLIVALRQIGYSLEQAIADLVDNSINAGAHNVLIRFLHDGESIQAIAVADDGAGMTDDQLTDAMRFGSSQKHDPDTLGKFGMGMKLASMSHAKEMTVYSRAETSSSARRWTMDGIAAGWWCERINNDAATTLLDRRWGVLDLTSSGTVVLWENIDRLPSHRSGLRYTLGALERRLKLHLGLCFHRFIESGRISLSLDQIMIDRQGQGLQSEIPALNPFGYPQSGHSDYPKVMTADLTGIGTLEFETHIWPAHSEEPEYRLGRRASSRQGMYFYRNDRLIQTGGWNGLVHDESEPHSSLARIAIDLPIEYDEWFGINVQKSSVLAPPVFVELLESQAANGTTFEDYRRTAVETYRNANQNNRDTAPYPEKGLPKHALDQLKRLYTKTDDASGFSVKWRKLPTSEFFRIDNEKNELHLNSSARESVASDTGYDNILKLLLSIIVRRDLRTPPGKSRQQELAVLNDVMVSLVDLDS
jgi:hypothetical protein